MRRGQILIEVVMAIAVAVVGVLALVSASTKSVSNSGASKRQSIATSYATQGVEWVRERRDNEDWATFYGRSGTYCLNDVSGSTWVTGSCSGTITGTEFTRTAVLTPLSNQLTVDIQVSWSEGGRTEMAKQTTIFTGF